MRLNVKEINAELSVIQSKSEAIEFFTNAAKKDFTAFDYETSGLSWERGYIVGTSFSCDRKSAVYIPMAHREKNAEPGAVAVMTEFLRNSPMVAHNVNFEYGWSRHCLGVEINIYSDTMIVIMIHNCLLPVALKEVVHKFYKHKMQTFEEVTNKTKDFTRVSVENGFYYACSDSLWTYRLMADLVPEIEKDTGKSSIYRMERQLLPITAEMHFHGIGVDMKELDSQKITIEAAVKVAEDDITKFIMTQCPQFMSQIDIMGNSSMTVNINSPKDLLKVFTSLGVDIQSTSKETLQDTKHPLAEKILEYRQIVKLLSTYNTPYYDMVEKNNNIHQGIIQIGAPTGRMAGAKPNLMSIPKIRD